MICIESIDIEFTCFRVDRLTIERRPCLLSKSISPSADLILTYTTCTQLRALFCRNNEVILIEISGSWIRSCILYSSVNSKLYSAYYESKNKI